MDAEAHASVIDRIDYRSEEKVMGKTATSAKVAAYAPGPMNVRCHAHKKDGTQCKRWALKGAKTCTSHGSGTKAARRKAAERIEASLDRAALAIVRLMEDPETPPAVKLAAARDLLDRGDLTGKQRVEVDVLAPWQAIAQRVVVPLASLEVYEEAVIVEDDSDLPPESV